MNNETNRLAQIIGSAADKYRGLAGLRPTEQDKAAAEAIEAEYLFIRRSELPKVEYIERDGKTHVQVNGSEAGTWPVKDNAATNRRWGLEYLAASIAIQEWHEKEAAQALSNACDTAFSPLRAAIDRIAEVLADYAIDNRK